MSTKSQLVQPFDTPACQTRECSYLGLVLMPPILLIGLLLFGGVREWFAQSRVEARLSAMLRDGQPIGNSSLTAIFDKSTSRKNTRGWNDVLAAANGIGAKFGRLEDHVEDINGVVPPDQTWDAAPFEQAYAEESKVIVDEIERLTGDSDKVWMPLLIEDSNTRLPQIQESRNIARVLRRDFRTAFHAGDHPRAMRAIRLMGPAAEAFECDTNVVVELVKIAIQGLKHGMLRESLRHDFWTAEELVELHEILSVKDDLDTDWRKLVAAERASMMASLRMAESGNLDTGATVAMPGLAPFGLSPVHQLSLLEMLEELENAGGGDGFELAKQVSDLTDAWLRNNNDPAVSLISIPLATAELTVIPHLMPAWQSVAYAFARCEAERRWTMTAVAIKQFKIQEDRWPEKLSELTSVGLSPMDWHVDSDETFGYQVAQDDQAAILWSLDMRRNDYQGQLIAPEPYSVKQPESDYLDSIEVQIR